MSIVEAATRHFRRNGLTPTREDFLRGLLTSTAIISAKLEEPHRTNRLRSSRQIIKDTEALLKIFEDRPEILEVNGGKIIDPKYYACVDGDNWRIGLSSGKHRLEYSINDAGGPTCTLQARNSPGEWVSQKKLLGPSLSELGLVVKLGESLVSRPSSS